MDIYAETILDHYRQPRGKVLLPDPTVQHTEVNVSCGDELTLQLVITDHHIEDVGWSGSGCAISQAGMSLLSEELRGKTVEEAEKLSSQDIYTLLGVPIGPRRVKCALLSLHTLKNALQIAGGKPEISWEETTRGL